MFKIRYLLVDFLACLVEGSLLIANAVCGERDLHMEQELREGREETWVRRGMDGYGAWWN